MATVDGAFEDESALRAARAEVEELSTPDGAFAVACRNTGVRPPPVSRARFETFADAERAHAAARRYRAALRDLDPGLAAFDLAVCEVADSTVGFASVRETTAGRRANGLPRTKRTVTLTGDASDEWLEIENAPVVDLVGPDALLDDEVVERQLRALVHRP
jgi:hypothetical protein